MPADLINPSVRARASDYAGQFQSAEPFRHVCIDDFLTPAAADRLLAQFPAVTDPSKLLNEFGDHNPKSAISDVRSLGPAYVEMDSFIQTPSFLKMMEQITGIPDLHYDPYYYGAGTHENFHGAGLDPHCDFNIHPKTVQHRRINAIVYLNKDWDPAWKGSICFHTNPWDLKGDRIKEVQAIFNRCVIFETTERSWHSVPPVTLPADKRQLSRKSFTIYLYTDTRPAEEAAPEHGTIYVQAGLSPHIKAGHTLTEDDVDEIHANLARRNSYLRNLYKREYTFSRYIGSLKEEIAALKRSSYVPLVGYAKLVSVSAPLYTDMFMDRHVEFAMRLLQPARGLRLACYCAEGFDEDTVITVAAGGARASKRVRRGELIEIDLTFSPALEGEQVVTIDADKSSPPPGGGDARSLSVVIDRVELVH